MDKYVLGLPRFLSIYLWYLVTGISKYKGILESIFAEEVETQPHDLLKHILLSDLFILRDE